ncbi:MAG: hypothetical protein M1833_006174 [Piccolia ochrophora]|nr:MAG: hypothetical protein M1833_006174 [Piccolia ochrophora]
MCGLAPLVRTHLRQRKRHRVKRGVSTSPVPAVKSIDDGGKGERRHMATQAPSIPPEIVHSRDLGLDFDSTSFDISVATHSLGIESENEMSQGWDDAPPPYSARRRSQDVSTSPAPNYQPRPSSPTTTLLVFRRRAGTEHADVLDLKRDIRRLQIAVERLTQHSAYCYASLDGDYSAFYVVCEGRCPSTPHEPNVATASAISRRMGLLKRTMDLVAVHSVGCYLHAIPLDAPVLALESYTMPGERREGFEATLAEVRHLLEDFAAPQRVVGSWCLPCRSDVHHDFLLLSGWDHEAGHIDFLRGRQFRDFRRLRAMLTSYSVMHLRRCDL